MFNMISCFIANSVDPDQTPRSAASDLGLHCLPLSLLWDATLKWVNITVNKFSVILLLTVPCPSCKGDTTDPYDICQRVI